MLFSGRPPRSFVVSAVRSAGVMTSNSTAVRATPRGPSTRATCSSKECLSGQPWTVSAIVTVTSSPAMATARTMSSSVTGRFSSGSITPASAWRTCASFTAIASRVAALRGPRSGSVPSGLARTVWHVFDIPALQVAIGLTFLFVVVALVCSTINELITTAVGLRARYPPAGHAQPAQRRHRDDGRGRADRPPLLQPPAHPGADPPGPRARHRVRSDGDDQVVAQAAVSLVPALEDIRRCADRPRRDLRGLWRRSTKRKRRQSRTG